MSEPRLSAEDEAAIRHQHLACTLACDERALLAEIDRLRGELSDRDRQLAELREACQPIVALVTPEVYSSVRCVAVTDLARLAALLPPPAKEESRV